MKSPIESEDEKRSTHIFNPPSAGSGSSFTSSPRSSAIFCAFARASEKGSCASKAPVMNGTVRSFTVLA